MAIDPTENSPFPGLDFAGELDDLQDLSQEVSMTDDWMGYLNQLLLIRLNEKHSGRLAYLRFLPDPETGMVIMVPARDETEYGATEVRYTGTENGAFVNLRRAVRRLNVQKQSGRVRIFPVVERTAPDGLVYLAFVVKNSSTRPARKLKPAEVKPTEPATGEQTG